MGVAALNSCPSSHLSEMFDKQQANTIFWSPQGQFVVLAGLRRWVLAFCFAGACWGLAGGQGCWLVWCGELGCGALQRDSYEVHVPYTLGSY